MGVNTDACVHHPASRSPKTAWETGILHDKNAIVPVQ